MVPKNPPRNQPMVLTPPPSFKSPEQVKELTPEIKRIEKKSSLKCVSSIASADLEIVI